MRNMRYLAGSALFLFMVVVQPCSAAETAADLFSFIMRTTNGSHSDQPIEVLAVEDQSGTEDDWNSYIEFTPRQGFHTEFAFDVPALETNEEWLRISLGNNYRGNAPSEQLWGWQIRNFCTNKWQGVGYTQQATSWQWTSMDFEVDGDPDCFIHARDKIVVSYLTNNTHDVSQLDSLRITLVKETDDPPSGNWWQPSPGTSWQWQLSGTLDTSLDVEMYDVDLEDTPQTTIDQLHSDGRVVICYFSAGSWESYRDDADLFPPEVIGLEMDGWPDEKWLDIRQIDQLGPIMEARLDKAVQKGCDGVEPDNVDGYTNNSGFPLTYQDQLNYNLWLAQEAHERNLSIGLKNDLDQVEDLVDSYDWALNEQCFQYNECDLLTPFIEAGKAVFGVEYSGDMTVFCPQANGMNFDWLYKNLDLDAYRESCR